MKHPSPPSPALRRCAQAAVLVCALAASGAASAQASALDELRRQVEAGQFDAAWASAQAQIGSLGDVHFDFLYGLAAINTGRVPEGVLALERHLSAVPGNDRARLELARGYFLLGEFPRARSEFEFVLRYNPPPPVRERINGFLQAMQTRDSGDRRPAARLYAEVGGGHDTNINAGTWRDSVLFLFGPVDLTGTPSRQLPDDFTAFAVGGQQVLRVGSRLTLQAGVDLDFKRHRDEQAWDVANLTGTVGFSQLAAGALWRGTFAASAMTLGDNRYRDMLQLGGEAVWTPAAGVQLSGFAQYAELRHAGAASVQDNRATSAGASVSVSPAGWPWQPTLGARVSFTREDNADARRDDLGKDIPLLRVFASFSPLPQLRVATGALVGKSSHRAEDRISFGTVRDDELLGADLVVNWTLDPRWSLRGEALWQVTRSNQDLYDTSRKSAALKLRYQF
jgi:hypothetical protein